MAVTLVYVALPNDPKNPHGNPLAYLELVVEVEPGLTLAIHEVKLLQIRGQLQLAMPHSKICDYCTKCHYKTPLLDSFCGKCGSELSQNPKTEPCPEDKRAKHYRDQVHPIDSHSRSALQDIVEAAYEAAIAHLRTLPEPHLFPICFAYHVANKTVVRAPRRDEIIN